MSCIGNKKTYIIGLDLGTSAIKGIAMAENGEILAEAKKDTRFIHRLKGWVEVDPHEHYMNLCSIVRELADAIPGPVCAISMAAASGNTLLADKNGRPLTNIINWMDQRVELNKLEKLKRFTVEEVREISGWPCVNTFPIAHFAWFAENHADLYGIADRYCMNTDWVLFKLTGKWVMDYSTATTFHLQEQTVHTYYGPFLERLNIPVEKLSKLMPMGRSIGYLTKQAMQDTGLSQDTQVVTGSFDHPSAARGVGVLEPGQLLLSCGTSWVGFFPEHDRQKIIRAELLCDPFLSATNGSWGAFFGIPYIGRNIDWYIDNLIAPGDDDKYSVFNSLAAEAPAGANGLVINLSEPPRVINAEKRNICRAIMENAARLLKERLDQLQRQGMRFADAIIVGGPSKSSLWPDIIEDISGLKLKIGSVYSGAKGAAILAGIGVGLYRDEYDGYDKTRGAHED